MAFLAQAAEQKVIDEYRRGHTLKRDMGRERLARAAGGDRWLRAPASADPTAQPGRPGQRGLGAAPAQGPRRDRAEASS